MSTAPGGGRRRSAHDPEGGRDTPGNETCQLSTVERKPSTGQYQTIGGNSWSLGLETRYGHHEHEEKGHVE